MAKTDWTLVDTILPDDMNDIGAEINVNADKLADNLDSRAWELVTLGQGVQIVQGGDVPAILHPAMQGRTLVNLLGRDGNCEDVSKFTPTSGNLVVSLDSANKSVGSNGYKMTWTSTSVPVVSGADSRDLFALINPAKYYIVVADLKNGTAAYTNIGVRLSGGIQYASTQVTDTSKFTTQYIVISPPDLIGATQFKIIPVISATAQNQYGHIDAIRVYEITVAEKSYIDGLTSVQAKSYIAANYPYVDDMKHVNAVYIENKGKNLLPPFSEWFPFDNSASVKYEVLDSFTVRMYGIGMTGTIVSPLIPVVPGQSYTISGGEVYSANSYFDIIFYDKNGVVIGLGVDGLSTGATKATGVAPLNAVYAKGRVITLAGATSGSFLVTNPMLNIGSEPLPFELQKPSYLYLPDCNFRSNIDGSIADRLYTDGQGKPRVTRRFREIVLDGSLDWAFVTDHAGFKRVSTASAKRQVDSDATNAVAIKYDGKILLLNSSAPTTGDQVSFLTSGAYISIADTDSGWGETYTPTADEIKAYFYGWRMVDGSLNPYPGNGTKYWVYANGLGGWTGTTTTLPTDFSPAVTNKTISSYRLMYQLAQSVDESVSYEGSLMLHEGANQVEVGTGIVVREVVVPSGVALDEYHINTNVNGIPNLLKNRPGRITNVFKKSVVDDWVKGIRSSDHVGLSVYGYGYAYIQKDRFDPTAAYSVTYLALDTYLLGIAPQTISTEYAPNIRESVESLVRELVEARTETSVLANTKAQKQQPQWVDPTFIGGWLKKSGGRSGYWKDDFGIVHIHADIEAGNTAGGSTILQLPQGYRPLTTIRLNGHVVGSATFAAFYITTSGEIKILSTSIAASSTITFSTSFRAEQ